MHDWARRLFFHGSDRLSVSRVAEIRFAHAWSMCLVGRRSLRSSARGGGWTRSNDRDSSPEEGMRSVRREDSCPTRARCPTPTLRTVAARRHTTRVSQWRGAAEAGASMPLLHEETLSRRSRRRELPVVLLRGCSCPVALRDVKRPRGSRTGCFWNGEGAPAACVAASAAPPPPSKLCSRRRGAEGPSRGVDASAETLRERPSPSPPPCPPSCGPAPCCAPGPTTLARTRPHSSCGPCAAPESGADTPSSGGAKDDLTAASSLALGIGRLRARRRARSGVS